MQIVRIDSNRNVTNADRIELVVGDKKFTITESFGELKIHAHSDSIIIKPGTANEIVITSIDN